MLSGSRHHVCCAAGTLLIWEQASHICLHVLVLSPKAKLRQLAKLPFPVLVNGTNETTVHTATWAPDSSIVLLALLVDYGDDLDEVTLLSSLPPSYLIFTDSCCRVRRFAVSSMFRMLHSTLG